MISLIVAVISLLGILAGRMIFQKWMNHLTIYCVIWGVLILLYEWKLLPYVDIIPLAWFYIFSAFLSFVLGVLTIVSARSLSNKEKAFNNKSKLELKIFSDNGRTVKYALLFFSAVGLFAAIQNWIVLVNMFGSIPMVFLNANTIYKLNVTRGIKGVIPYISSFGYVAIFFSAIYSAYKGRFSFLTLLPFIGIIIKELATVGRAGMLLALMEFIFTFFLFRYLLKDEPFSRFKFSKKNAIIVFMLMAVFFIASASLVRITRGSGEYYPGASKELRELKNNFIITPSIYLYLSSDIGVLSQYLKLGDEQTKFGENTFLLFHDFLAKLDVIKRPPDFQKGYKIPMWTNTGTYIRELHADFGITGVFLGPYLIGLLITWLWFRFYKGHSMIILAILSYFYLIIGFSFLVMISRLSIWVISLFIIIICIPILEKIATIFNTENFIKSNY